MNVKIICPISGDELQESEEGLIDQHNTLRYPKVNGAFRVAQGDNYTTNFGIEWNNFQKTQIDKFNNTQTSYNRFFKETEWNTDLSGQNVLEVGSGAGRFTQIVLDHTQAHLYSVDYSNAVEANFKNNGPHKHLHLFQASIYDLPFQKGSFDKVFCFGVLQHTPDVEKSIRCLVEMVKPGGQLVVDFYPIKGWYSKINAKYLLRPITKRVAPHTLLSIIQKNMPWLILAYKFNKKVGLGRLNRFLPICDIDATFPKEISKIKEWAVLDTFDMFSPAYDAPQRLETVKHLFEKFGMTHVQAQMVAYEPHLVAAVVKGNH